MPPNYFSEDYFTARSRFRELASKAGADLDQLVIDARGPNDEELTIDIARIGPRDAERVLLHTSGVHGVEGFLDSAIQLQLLAELPQLDSRCALLIVHVVNPYGMAWLRRVNENNVDLNRNFLADDEEYSGAPDGYRMLDPLINPAGPPSKDFFTLRSAWYIARYGMRHLKQAVAAGQYEFPKGLFFGGKELEQGPSLLLDWLQRELAEVRAAAAIDVHSGLGPYGVDSLLVSYPADSERYRSLKQHLGDRVTPLEPSGVAYRLRGGFMDALEREWRDIRWTCVGQEFGTLRPRNVLQALRDENRWHHYGQKERLDHPAKQRLLAAFCPHDQHWRQAVLRRGRELIDTMLNINFAI